MSYCSHINITSVQISQFLLFTRYLLNFPAIDSFNLKIFKVGKLRGQLQILKTKTQTIPNLRVLSYFHHLYHIISKMGIHIPVFFSTRILRQSYYTGKPGLELVILLSQPLEFITMPASSFSLVCTKKVG